MLCYFNFFYFNFLSLESPNELYCMLRLGDFHRMVAADISIFVKDILLQEYVYACGFKETPFELKRVRLS